MRLAIDADPAWAIDHFQVGVAGSVAITDASDEISVVLPDELAGQLARVDVWGLSGGHQVAYGSTEVALIKHETVRIDVALEPLHCASTCDPGMTKCQSDAVMRCERQADGCFAWSAPMACPANAPSCSLGECSTTCVDECDDGAVDCADAASTHQCGNYDSDSCRDWSPAMACPSSAPACSSGTCASTCAHECDAGDRGCADATSTHVCGNFDADPCREWSAPGPCDSGTCRDDACSPGVCDLIAQTGCGPLERCTWVKDQADPPIGHLACMPDGTIPVGGACMFAATGVDACIAGSLCLMDQCMPLCDPNGGPSGCGATQRCNTYTGLAMSGTTFLAGLCNDGCDPLTQELPDGTAACRSPTPSQPSRGCYGEQVHSCMPSWEELWSLTDRDQPRLSPSGVPWNNGCAPGFQPMLYEMTGSTRLVCAGLCAALDTDNTPALSANADGDPMARGKLPTSSSAAVGNATCSIGKKGSRASSECRFMWWFEDDTGLRPDFISSGLADRLGLCIALEYFKYDANADMVPETTFPSCSTLPPRNAFTLGPHDDAIDWGCYRYTTAIAKGAATRTTDVRLYASETATTGPHRLVD